MLVPDGYGNHVPPLESHVIIYFLEKGMPVNEALAFFQHFSKRQWKNHRQQSLSNWKTAAWEWILKQIIQKSHP